jgi:hypothetical protein
MFITITLVIITIHNYLKMMKMVQIKKVLIIVIVTCLSIMEIFY